MMHIKETCCFTGHRSIPAGLDKFLGERSSAGIEYLYKQGIKNFLVGGALGFDTIAAHSVIKQRESHSDIQLIVVAPCQDQDKYWVQKDKDIYTKIKKDADEVITLSENYYQGCMQDRNRYLVDNSIACICYLTQISGGTAYTVSYAKSKGLTVYNLARRKA